MKTRLLAGVLLLAACDSATAPEVPPFPVERTADIFAEMIAPLRGHPDNIVRRCFRAGDDIRCPLPSWDAECRASGTLTTTGSSVSWEWCRDLLWYVDGYMTKSTGSRWAGHVTLRYKKYEYEWECPVEVSAEVVTICGATVPRPA